MNCYELSVLPPDPSRNRHTAFDLLDFAVGTTTIIVVPLPTLDSAVIEPEA